ncbi:MAG: hypothetical protein NWE85_02630, partial [Candidatus Bathyarchaeota archaeon]|nr:hypothetical protein [Candidatus Bathyarchaeota archaeon]
MQETKRARCDKPLLTGNVKELGVKDTRSRQEWIDLLRKYCPSKLKGDVRVKNYLLGFPEQLEGLETKDRMNNIWLNEMNSSSLSHDTLFSQ